MRRCGARIVSLSSDRHRHRPVFRYAAGSRTTFTHQTSLLPSALSSAGARSRGSRTRTPRAPSDERDALVEAPVVGRQDVTAAQREDVADARLLEHAGDEPAAAAAARILSRLCPYRSGCTT